MKYDFAGCFHSAKVFGYSFDDCYCFYFFEYIFNIKILRKTALRASNFLISHSLSHIPYF